MFAVSSGFPENLAAKLGFAPDVIAVRGSSATPARMNLARRADNLTGKKLVVWCFTVRGVHRRFRLAEDPSHSKIAMVS